MNALMIIRRGDGDPYAGLSRSGAGSSENHATSVCLPGRIALTDGINFRIVIKMPYRTLDAATVRVRWLSLDGRTERRVESWRRLLDGEEISRADRFFNASDRATFIAAHALARTMLGEAMNLHPRSFRFVVGPRGKPAVASDLGGAVHFNVSHTRGLAACAVTRCCELGLDVEALDRWHDDFGIVCRFFHAKEIRLVHDAPPDRRALVFFRLWTLKEAFVKATGEGLSRPLSSFAFELDPVRIDFDPRCDDASAHENPPGRSDTTRWQFAEYRPGPHQLLSLAVRCERGTRVLIDASPIRPEELSTDDRILHSPQCHSVV
jgi:4'-phosphopantetheinyl transferase